MPGRLSRSHRRDVKEQSACGSLECAFAVRTSAVSEIQRRRRDRREKWSSPSNLPWGKVFARKVAGDERAPESRAGCCAYFISLRPPQRPGREEVTHTNKSSRRKKRTLLPAWQGRTVDGELRLGLDNVQRPGAGRGAVILDGVRCGVHGVAHPLEPCGSGVTVDYRQRDHVARRVGLRVAAGEGAVVVALVLRDPAARAPDAQLVAQPPPQPARRPRHRRSIAAGLAGVGVGSTRMPRGTTVPPAVYRPVRVDAFWAARATSPITPACLLCWDWRHGWSNTMASS